MKVNAEKKKEDNKVKKKSIAAVLSGFLALGLAVATAAAGKNATYTTAGKTWNQVDEKKKCRMDIGLMERENERIL